MKKLTAFLKRYGFSLCVVGILLFPLYGGLVHKLMPQPLVGVSLTTPVPAVSRENVLNGTFQTEVNNWWQENFAGRNFWIRLRNQILYSALHTSSNTNVSIGKNGQLYEAGYIYNYCAGSRFMSDEELSQVVQQTEALQTLLNENGKELYLFLTPSKARYESDYYPWYYDLGPKHDEQSYEFNRFLGMLEKSNLKYFNSIEFIDNHPDLFTGPVFYPTSTHWSRTWGDACASALADYISETSEYTLHHATVTEIPVDTPVDPSTDLYQLLNLFSTAPASVQYHSPQIALSGGSDTPNVFYRGNSFMGQSLDMLIQNGFWNENVHFENASFFSHNFSQLKTLSSMYAYDEVDPAQLYQSLQNADILILAANEGTFSISDSIFLGFPEYLLAHPELIRGE